MASNLPSTQKEDWSLNDKVLPEHTNSWGSAINKLTKAIPIYASNGNYYKVQSFSNNIITLSPVTDEDDSTNETVDSYVDGMQVIFQSTFDTAEDCSVNINNLGTKQIKTVKNKPISTGDITLGNFVQLIYSKNADVFYLAGQSQDSNRSGVELCTILCMPFGVDESENKYRYLNGQTIVQSQYPAFTAKVKSWQSTRASLFTTEEEWQSIQANSKLGQCGKFVIDDEAGTIRLPAIVNINGLTDLSKCGLIKDESLPAHKHTRGTMEISGALGTVHQYDYYENGAFYRSWTGTKTGSGGGKGDWSNWEFRASRNWTGSTSAPDNATYQDDAPVQQEAVQYPYVICVNTGVEEAERPINNYQVNNTNSLLEGKYTDHILNNLSWLRSQGQYNSGTIYNKAYELILKIYNGTETIEGISVKAKGDSSITDYDFVIDTTNTKFRLPIKSRLASGKAVVGNGVALGITDTINNFGLAGASNQPDRVYGNTGFYGKNTGSKSIAGTMLANDNALGVTTDGSKSGIETDDTGIYLYYYVGDTLQNLDLINIARIQEQITDINTQSRGYLVESYTDGTSGYRLYSDGFCEQRGYSNVDSNTLRTITFLKPYKDTNYVVTLGASNINDNNQNSRIAKVASITTKNMVVTGIFDNALGADFHFYWRTCGYVK